MAKSRPVTATAAPPAPKGERPIMNNRTDHPSPQAENCGEDPFALTENCDFPLPSQAAKGPTPAALEVKSAEDDDDEIAMPIPIATLVFQDGRTEPVYKPLAGHEHLFRAQPMISSPRAFSNRISGAPRLIQAAPTRASGTPQPTIPEQPQQIKPQKQSSRRPRRVVAQKPGLLKSKSLKRTRSVAQGLAPNRKADVDNDGDDAGDSPVEVTTEESHTFYIGDIDAFKEFLHCRFDELTMKPLRGIATHWVKLLEPRRLGDWGKYHEMLPSEADTPPWWPETVIYKEPSHLKKDDLSTLAVEMMLIHRKIDEIKRKGSWISKLRDVAKFTVQTTSADNFSSSKGAVHSEEMKARALDQILPSIFDVAQSYEDHIMQYSLFEGSGNIDPGRGKQHTWKPIPRPVRRTQQPKRPRKRTTQGPDLAQEALCEASGDETEPDDTMTRFARVPCGLPQPIAPHQLLPGPSPAAVHTPRQSFSAEDIHQRSWKVDTPVSTSGPCTPAYPHEDAKMYRTASTPNSSFDQSLHGLHIEEENMDLKPQTRTMSEQGSMQPYNVVTYSQPMQYPSTPAPFNSQAYQPTGNYPEQAPSSYVQTGPTFVNPFSMYPAAPPPPMGYGQYATPMATSSGYQYDQSMYPQTPVSFPSTPMGMHMAPSDPNMTYNGLPSDYTVDPQGLHRF